VNHMTYKKDQLYEDTDTLENPQEFLNELREVLQIEAQLWSEANRKNQSKHYNFK